MSHCNIGQLQMGKLVHPAQLRRNCKTLVNSNKGHQFLIRTSRPFLASVRRSSQPPTMCRVQIPPPAFCVRLVSLAGYLPPSPRPHKSSQWSP